MYYLNDLGGGVIEPQRIHIFLMTRDVPLARARTQFFMAS